MKQGVPAQVRAETSPLFGRAEHFARFHSENASFSEPFSSADLVVNIVLCLQFGTLA